jgi:hypothetical protein
MNWIKGATNNCNFLDIFTDRFEELNKEEMTIFQRQKGQRKLGRLEVRELPLKVDS